MSFQHDAVVVGAGPNGLAAAITLARAGLDVLLLEANPEPGGGARSAELTLPGFVHDTFSSIYPLGIASPFLRSLELERYGLEWVQPRLPLVHPLDDGEAAFLDRSLTRTAEGLGGDGAAYRRLLGPLVAHRESLLFEVLQPPLHVPRFPITLCRFVGAALRSASSLARSFFQTEAARGLFAGLAAHSFLPLGQRASAATGLILNLLAHGAGWPLPRGGSGRIAAALVACFQQLRGKLEINHPVRSIDELPPARAVLLDVSPRQMLSLAGHRLPPRYCRALERFRYGPGVFKIDYALASPIPWRAPACAQAGTVHLGGSLIEIEQAEQQTANGGHPERPFVLLAQPSLFDETRAPAGRHVAWAYCHVPNGSTADMTRAIEDQIERFAPGFRDCILERRVCGPQLLERDNANLIGGDINGGQADLWQMIARPVFSAFPYKTPRKELFLCSASTPPGGGVHGMCGHLAARCVLRSVFKDGSAPLPSYPKLLL